MSPEKEMLYALHETKLQRDIRRRELHVFYYVDKINNNSCSKE